MAAISNIAGPSHPVATILLSFMDTWFIWWFWLARKRGWVFNLGFDLHSQTIQPRKQTILSHLQTIKKKALYRTPPSNKKKSSRETRKETPPYLLKG